MGSLFFSKKGIIVLLIFTIVVTFIFYNFFARKIDREYSKLINKEAHFNAISQQILQTSYANWATFLEYACNNQKAIRINNWEQVIVQNNKRFDSISILNLLHPTDSLILDSLKTSRKKYNTLITYYYNHLPGNADSIQTVISNVLKPSFQQYQYYLAKFLKAHNQGMLQISDNFTYSNLFKSKVYMLLSLIPIFIIIFVVLLIFIYILIIGYEIIKI